MFSPVNTIWVLMAAVLVFFMQAGFAMLESGFIRAKNTGNIIMKNLIDFCIGSLIFWFMGFGIMFGNGNRIIGRIDFFLNGEYTHILPNGVQFFSYFLFQTVVCATATTIVSGAMAERIKFRSYCLYSVLISLIIYPISGHWIWGGGWLSQLGFHDFAGSTAVHLVGGTTALIGAKLLGPRIGKYSEKGESRAIPGHSMTIGALGIFILWFGWFGFNGGSNLAIDTDEAITSIGKILVTTNLSAASAATTAMLFTWIRYKKPDVSMTLNGALGGLVAITGGCDVVSPFGGALIGAAAGVVVVLAIELIDKQLKIDDPVGAIGVHAGCGTLGTILIGFFSVKNGFFYTGKLVSIGTQLLGVLSVSAWVGISSTAMFLLIKKTVGLRVAEKDEIAGLDQSEHGLSNAYADFIATTQLTDFFNKSDVNPAIADTDTNADLFISPEIQKIDSTKNKISKVVIVTRQEKFEALKKAMNDIGVVGMTVTQVLGFGVQKGTREFYRGIETEPQLLPKIQVEFVVAKVPVSKIIRRAREVLYTNNIGDGKIFVFNVEEVVRVRTGETGYDALQGVDE